MTYLVTFGSKPGIEPVEVLADGVPVGRVRTPVHGPGFFLTLYGKTWKNAAPGARVQQERDFVAKETYCKTQKLVKERVYQNVTQDEINARRKAEAGVTLPSQ